MKFIVGIIAGVLLAILILYFREQSFRKALEKIEEQEKNLGMIENPFPQPKPYLGKAVFDWVCWIINKMKF